MPRAAKAALGRELTIQRAIGRGLSWGSRVTRCDRCLCSQACVGGKVEEEVKSIVLYVPVQEHRR